MNDALMFGPGSMAWALCRERTVGAMAPRAVILQFAHPAFAAASERYAVRDTEPGARFGRAVDTLLAMVFGTHDEALGHARRIARLHASIGARDREAYGWVMITLADAVMRGAELARGPLSSEESARFLEDTRHLGRLFGVDPRELPGSRDELEARVTWMVRERLVVGEEVRTIWEFMVAGSEDVGSRLRSALLGGWIASTLPGPIAARLGVATPRTRWVQPTARVVGPTFAAATPGAVRYVHAYQASTCAR